MLCVGLILSTAACKKQNNESALSDEYEIVYEYIEEPSDNDDSSETATESNQVNSNKSESSNNESIIDSESASNSSDEKTDSSEKPKDAVYKSESELFEANPPVNSIVTLEIEPYATGKYKIVNGSYVANNSSIIYVSSGKFAIRYTERAVL